MVEEWDDKNIGSSREEESFYSGRGDVTIFLTVASLDSLKGKSQIFSASSGPCMNLGRRWQGKKEWGMLRNKWKLGIIFDDTEDKVDSHKTW
jgi:hypothetical protein